MDTAEQRRHVGEAQREIEDLLTALEAKIGRPVVGLSLERVDATQLQDAQARYLPCVRIEVGKG